MAETSSSKCICLLFLDILLSAELALMDLSQGFTLHLCNPLFNHFAQAQRNVKELKSCVQRDSARKRCTNL